MVDFPVLGAAAAESCISNRQLWDDLPVLRQQTVNDRNHLRLSAAYRRVVVIEDGAGGDDSPGDWQVSRIGGRRLMSLEGGNRGQLSTQSTVV